MERHPSIQFLEIRTRHIKIFHRDFNFPVEFLAKHYGMSPAAVEDALQEPPTPIKSQEKLQDKLPRIYELWRKGKTLRQLAIRYGCTRDVLRRALKKYTEAISPGHYDEVMRINRDERKAKSGSRRTTAGRSHKE